MAEQIKIENVGPIRTLEFSVAPGVTVLRGRNESGKSTAINAVGALTGRKHELQARDGEPVGSIQGPGVTLVVSRTARNTRSGELTVESVDDRIDLASLVDPSLKDAAARTRARIKSLLALTQAEIPAAAWKSHDPDGIVPSDDIDVSDPIATHGKVKRRLEAAARSHADRSREYVQDAGRVKGSLEALGDLPAGCPSVEEATAQRRGRTRTHDALLSERERFESRKEKHAGIRARYEAAIESAKDQTAKLAEAKGILEQATTELDDTRSQIEINERRIVSLQEESRELRATEGRLEDRIANTSEMLVTIEAQRDTIKSLKEAANAAIESGPSDDEISAAEAALTASESVVDSAKNAEEIAGLKQRHNELLTSSKEAKKTSSALRASAKALDSVLADAIDSPYFTLLDGELYYTGHGEDGREPEPYDRLSDGKRWTVAIAAVSFGLHTGEASLALVGVSQTAWESLDTANRASVTKAAVDARLAIVTAEHDDSETVHASEQDVPV